MEFKPYLAKKMESCSIGKEERGYREFNLVIHHGTVENDRLVLLPAFHNAVRPVLDRHLYEHLEENDIIPEVGCGTGFFYRRIAPDWLKKHLLCTDINSASLDSFKKYNSKAEMITASIYQMPFGDDSVPAIIGYSAFDGLLFLGEAFGEMRRVLRNDGKLMLFQDLFTDIYLMKEEDAIKNASLAAERYHQRLMEEAVNAGFRIVEGKQDLEGFAVEPFQNIRN